MGDDDKRHMGLMDTGEPSREGGWDASHTIPLSRKALLGDLNIQQRAYLEVTGTSENVRGVHLGEGEVFLGRSAECEVHLPFNNISRKHARVFFRNEEYSIEDLNSTNGTYVNGVRIVRCVLRSNDQIQIGEAKIYFVEERTCQR